VARAGITGDGPQRRRERLLATSTWKTKLCLIWYVWSPVLGLWELLMTGWFECHAARALILTRLWRGPRRTRRHARAFDRGRRGADRAENAQLRMERDVLKRSVVPSVLCRAPDYCRGRCRTVCAARDSRVRTRHNQSRLIARLLSKKHLWRGADHERPSDAGAVERAVGPVCGRMPNGGAEWGYTPSSAAGNA
jgi:hypothetical protein